MRVSFVVAAAENGLIGRNNQLPWRLPDDLKWFKSVTLGKPILMGRKTFESIGKPLPGRTNIVLSTQRDLQLPGCVVVGSLQKAIEAADGADELAIIGGAKVYEQAMSRADLIYLTRVHASPDGDAFLPTLDPAEWRERIVEHHPMDERHAYAFTFLELTRVRAPSGRTQ